MNRGKAKFTCEEIKALDLVTYVAALGYHPQKIRGNDYWYLSPFRIERTASFKINRAKNRWFDHGLGKGGNLIDFGILYHHCTVAELLKKLDSDFSFQKPNFEDHKTGFHENQIQISYTGAIQSAALLHYLKQRCIPVALASEYCQEVHYLLNEKKYFAIGFKNDAGGYELRNAFFKNSSSPKSITTIGNGSNRLIVCEGFFDFLSVLVLQQSLAQSLPDFCILNSLSFFTQLFALKNRYNAIDLFLDNDKAGQNCRHLAIKNDSKFINQSQLYTGYKDVNEWLVNIKSGNSAGSLNLPP